MTPLACGRVLIAKPGLDGHDRGAKVVAMALRDAGFEVIYSGLRQTPEAIAEVALQEDVDAVGLSSLSGAHGSVFPAVVRELKARGLDTVVVFGGGVIPDEHIDELRDQGITRVFTPGSSLAEIVNWLHGALDNKRLQEA